jgi:tetratricopeptide (TPR) repeat protein
MTCLVRWSRSASALCLATLYGCNAPPPVAPPSAVSRQEHVASTPAPSDGPLDELQSQWSARLEWAERHGQHARAAVALDVLVLLDAAQYTPRRNEFTRQLTLLVDERLRLGRKAQQAGKLEAAEQIFLSALALQPSNSDAASALRAIDRARNKRDHLGQPSTITLTRRFAVPATTAQVAMRLEASMAREHASMLATQGEFDDAIGLLEDQLRRERRDAATRSLLVDLYVRQAQTLRQRDPAASRAALNKALRLAPRHAPALALLKQLPPASPTVAPGTRPTP